MRVLLAMLARRHGEPFLEQCRAVLEPSFDGVEILYDEGDGIADFAAARNHLIALGERSHYDWIVMLDADECMFPADVAHLRHLMGGAHHLIVMPRINLARDMTHFAPEFYPDYQGRAFRLGNSYHYSGAVHEQLTVGLSRRSALRGSRCMVSQATPIFHYGLVQEESRVLLKAVNYDRIAVGEQLLDELPENLDPGYVRDLLGPVSADRLRELDIPHPLGQPVPGDHVSGWAGFYVCSRTIQQETGHLHEHAELLGRLDDDRLPLLEVGAGHGSLGRYLAQRGHDVVVTDADAIVTGRLARSAGACPGLRVQMADALQLGACFERSAFGTAFSEGLFQHSDDEQARTALSSQLKVARRVLASVPVTPPPGLPGLFGDERCRSADEWLEILSPVAEVKATLYGHRYLPLRQAVVAKMRGNLVQAGTHMMLEAYS